MHFSGDEDVARQLDAEDPLRGFRENFSLPLGNNGKPMARLVGAKPHEVISMNSLTVNLHLMMATFYQPTKSRFKILMEEPAFPSDTYAIKTQITHHGLDPKDALVLARRRKGEFTTGTGDVIELIEKQADQLALVMLPGVNFFTGQLFDIEKITAAARN